MNYKSINEYIKSNCLHGAAKNRRAFVTKTLIFIILRNSVLIMQRDSLPCFSGKTG